MRLILLLVIAVISILSFYLWRQNRKIKTDMRSMRRKLRSTTGHLAQVEARHRNDLAAQGESGDRLRGYLEFLDALINTIPNPIFFFDQDNVCRGCNKAFAGDVVGILRENIIGSRFQELSSDMARELATVLQHKWPKNRNSHQRQSFEAKLVNSNGGHRDFFFSLGDVCDGKGQVIGSVGVMLDLTSKNQAVRERVRKEKLQGVLETAGAVCHEMNQPIQAISGFTELALGDASCSEKTLNYLSKIESLTERMGSITRRLQRITRYKTTVYAGGSTIIDIDKSSKT